MNKARLQILYVWLGVAFVWVGGYFANDCLGCHGVGFAIAGGISAVAMWFTATAMRDIYKS